MIKIFRKIRQKLLIENKFSKYLLYAIGEIVLVVIGILIALQINDWNESHKLEKLELELLAEVKNGLSFDLQKIEETILYEKDVINSQNEVIRWLQSDGSFQNSLAIDFLKTFFSSDLTFKDGPYETLKLVGLKIVKNDSLSNHISNIYDLRYDEIQFKKDLLIETNLHYRDLLGENRFKFLNSKNAREGLKPLIESKLKTDESFLFNLAFLKGGVENYVLGLEELKVEVDQLINHIDSELSSRRLSRLNP